MTVITVGDTVRELETGKVGYVIEESEGSFLVSFDNDVLCPYFARELELIDTHRMDVVK